MCTLELIVFVSIAGIVGFSLHLYSRVYVDYIAPDQLSTRDDVIAGSWVTTKLRRY
jgi:hypothetical protein